MATASSSSYSAQSAQSPRRLPAEPRRARNPKKCDALDRRCPTPCETMPLCSLRNLRPVLDSLSSLIDLHCESISMPGLILHTSNQLDLLARRLSDVVSAPLGSPFTPEIVVVQSLASRRWLSLEIARRQGICANYAFPFLGRFAVARDVEQASTVETPADRMSTELLTWKIYSLLPLCLARKEFARWLTNMPSRRRLLETFSPRHQAGQSLRPIPRLSARNVFRVGLHPNNPGAETKRGGRAWRQLGETPLSISTDRFGASRDFKDYRPCLIFRSASQSSLRPACLQLTWNSFSNSPASGNCICFSYGRRANIEETIPPQNNGRVSASAPQIQPPAILSLLPGERLMQT